MRYVPPHYRASGFLAPLWRPLRAVALFGGLLLCGHAQAQTAPSPDLPALYVQALQAMAQNQPDLAQSLLQSVVQQHPELAGAWLDLAWLAVGQGRFPEADEYLIALEQKFTPLPPEIATVLGRLRARIDAHLLPAQAPTQDAVQVGQTALVIGAGYEDNANSGLQMSTITLTTPYGDATLNVDPASQPKSASYLRLGVVHQQNQAWLDGQLRWQVQAQARQYDVLSQFNNTEILPQVTLQHPELPGLLTLGWQAIWLNSQATYQAPIVRWQLDTALAACTGRQQMQAEERQYLQATHLDSHWVSYRSTWQCPSLAPLAQAHMQLAQESASHTNRPGGDTLHLSVGLQKEWLAPLGLDGHTLQAKADWLQSQDSDSYTSLLDNGKPRRLSRFDAQLIWSGPLAGESTWRWSISANVNRQESNIAFFNQRNFSLETSVWRSW